MSRLKIGMALQLVIKKELKRNGQNIFENMLNRDRVVGKYIEENEKVYDTLNVKEEPSDERW